jgi:aerobic carbon-monoxide dehydrogenase medium subunit
MRRRIAEAWGADVKLHWPKTVAEAVEILARDEDARAHAGGATLVAMMNAGLVAPSALVFLRAIDELKEIAARPDGSIAIGAMATHKAVASCDAFVDGQAVVGLAARRIGHPPIRSQGTIGGAVAHADPAADYPAALVAADATIEIVGRDGTRAHPADTFFEDYYETALADGEIVRAVTIPRAPPGSVAVYDKLARVDGDFATVSVALVLAMKGGRCTHVRLVAGGVGATPVRAAAAEQLLHGTTLAATELAAAAELLAGQCDPIDDVRASARYRLAVLPRMVARAFATARQHMGGGQ